MFCWLPRIPTAPSQSRKLQFLTAIPLPHSFHRAEEAKEEGEAEAAPEYDAAAGFAGAPLPSGEEAAGFDAYG